MRLYVWHLENCKALKLLKIIQYKAKYKVKNLSFNRKAKILKSQWCWSNFLKIRKETGRWYPGRLKDSIRITQSLVDTA